MNAAMKSLIGKILGKTADKPMGGENATKPVAPAPPPIDAQKLRQAVDGAAGAEERAKAERTLGRALAGARQSPAPHDGPEVWIEAACQVADKALATEWTGLIRDAPHLAEVAVRGRFTEVRLAAARRIADIAVLERIAEASRDKDKGVYRHCNDILKARKLAGERAQRVAVLAQTLHSLLETSPLASSRLQEVDRELASLGGGDDVAECATLLEQARNRVREESQALRDLQARAGEAEALRAEAAADLWPLMDMLGQWHERAAALSQCLAQCPAWLADHAAARRLDQALLDIGLRLAALELDAARERECVSFLDTQPADAPISAAAADLWTALVKPSGAAARAALDVRWNALSAHAASPPPPSIEVTATPEAPLESERTRKPTRQKVDFDAVANLLDQLEQALEQGHLHDADVTDRKIEEGLHGAALRGSLAARRRRAGAQLGRLRGWARWGTDQAREHLITAADDLLRSEPDVDERAHVVPALRAEWKRLDAHGPSSKSQWDRFDSALEKAYQPVLARRAEEAARNEIARNAKEALLSEWEGWSAGVVWEHADYKVVETRRQEILSQWRACARAGFKDERRLNKRLDAMLSVIDSMLDEARTSEIRRREQLIAAAEAFKDAPDIGRAVTEAKGLQERWQKEANAVHLARKEEQKLWARFRAALDVVFARRDAKRAEVTAQREQKSQALRDLIEGFEQALNAASDSGEIERALSEFRNAWSGAEEHRHRERPDPLETKARELMQRARVSGAALRRDKHQARFALMAQKAALAQRVEAAAVAGAPTQELVAEARQAWDALPHLPNNVDRLLADRLTQGTAATGEKLVQGQASRDAMLIDLEIAIGLPTPEALAESRRIRQLERLQNRFGGAVTQPQDPEMLVAKWYATAASADPAQELRIAAIVRKLLETSGAPEG
jgi:DNA repair protein SbcC/Rad50